MLIIDFVFLRKFVIKTNISYIPDCEKIERLMPDTNMLYFKKYMLSSINDG